MLEFFVEGVEGVEGESTGTSVIKVGNETLRGVKLKQFFSVPQHIQNSPGVAILNHGVEILFVSISGVFDDNENLIQLIDGQTVPFDSDILIIKKKDTPVVQPWQYLFDEARSDRGRYIYYSIESLNFNVQRKTLTRSPTFIAFSKLEDIKAKSEKDKFVILFEGLPSMDSSESNIFGGLKFEMYEIVDKRKKYFISEPIENLDTVLESSNSLFMNHYITILRITASRSMNVKYNFQKEFFGWSFIVVPFLSFIKGLSVLDDKFISARFFHLPQSSGYGKTRVCFEALKFLKGGIYCVYRGEKDKGYPSTTPWMKQLFDAFNSSTSDKRSIYICAKFVQQAVTYFEKFEDGVPETIELFQGDNQELALKFNFKFDDPSICDSNEIIRNLKEKQKDIFFLVFDECHELLKPPNNFKSGLSLYRAMRRVLFDIKTSKIVAVFLGTKSSLEDFVLNARRDPSTREKGDDIDNGFPVPPYILTQSVDAMLTESFVISYEAASNIKTIFNTFICSSQVLKTVAINCGRPLWDGYESFEKAFELASTKLNTEASLLELTCLVSRTGSSVVPQDQLAHKLVLSGMATLLQLDVNGSMCLIEYIPEPVLSNASRFALLNCNNYAKSIQEYVKRLKLGTFHDSGTAGELVARIVLLRAMDLALLRPKGHSKAKVVYNMADVMVFDFLTLFGENASAECLAKFKDTSVYLETVSALNPIADRSQVKSASTKTEFIPSAKINANLRKVDKKKESNVVEYLSPKLGVTTLREYLLMLSDVVNEDFSRFGVSDAVLDGLVNFNQFIQLDNPLYINQIYLLEGFAKFVAFILPPRAPGVDLLIPVLRTDNRMSCVVVQVKNYATDVFPYNEKEINDKLKSSNLNFLDFSAIGDFEACPIDDFIRIVIQFREKKPFSSQPNSFAQWVPITGSKSSNSISRVCNSLWMFGLDHFAKSLFFENTEIIKNLNIILSGQRDFLNFIDYPEVKLPTRLQTTKLGAQFLVDCGRPLANYNQLISKKSRIEGIKDGFEYEKQIIEKYEENMLKLDIPKFAKDYQSKACFSTKKAVTEAEAVTVAEAEGVVSDVISEAANITTETNPDASMPLTPTVLNPETSAAESGQATDSQNSSSSGNSQNSSVISEKSAERRNEVNSILDKILSSNLAYKSKSAYKASYDQYEDLYKQKKSFEIKICKVLVDRATKKRKSQTSTRNPRKNSSATSQFVVTSPGDPHEKDVEERPTAPPLRTSNRRSLKNPSQASTSFKKPKKE